MAGEDPPRATEYRRARAVPRIREETRTFFRLSPAGQSASHATTGFAVRRGECRIRLNPSFFAGGFQALLTRLSAIPTIRPLGGLIAEGGFGVLPPGDSYLPEGGIRFLRPTEMKEGNQIDWDACLRAPAEFGRHERARVLVGDVLLAVKGATIAAEKSVCLIDELSEPTIVNGSIFRFHPKRSDVSGEFLLEVLSSSLARQQMKGAMILNNAVDYLSRDVIDQLLLPIPPSTAQSRLVRKMAASRAARRHKLAEADDLLSGLDSFVLDVLGLTVPAPDDNRRTYAVRARDVLSTKKLHPDYFHPERFGAIRAVERKYKADRCVTLLSLADFRRDQRQVQPGEDYLGLANVQSNTGERIESTEEDGKGTVFEYAKDDVLFARLRPYLNKVYRAESDGVCSPEFHVMRIRDDADGKRRMVPDYLAAVLRSSVVLAQTRHMMTGNTHPRLANDDVGNLVIPVPDNTVQAKIAAEVVRRRESARVLRNEAARLWEQAKAEFEAALLGRTN